MLLLTGQVQLHMNVDKTSQNAAARLHLCHAVTHEAAGCQSKVETPTMQIQHW